MKEDETIDDILKQFEMSHYEIIGNASIPVYECKKCKGDVLYLDILVHYNSHKNGNKTA